MGTLARHAPTIDGLRHTERDARRRGRDVQGELVMTAIQAHYAQYLVRASRGLTMSTLAEHTRTSAPNISQVVGRMERHGLVRRVPSDRDGRCVLVRITAYGTHQFWQLLRLLRKLEAKYRADAVAKPMHNLAAVLRRVGPPLNTLAPAPPFNLRRWKPRRAQPAFMPGT